MPPGELLHDSGGPRRRGELRSLAIGLIAGTDGRTRSNHIHVLNAQSES